MAIKVGDRVELLCVPAWLVRDLPEDEQQTILSYVGLKTTVTDVDQHGYCWIGFGETSDEPRGASRYAGHSFCVTDDCLRKSA